MNAVSDTAKEKILLATYEGLKTYTRNKRMMYLVFFIGGIGFGYCAGDVVIDKVKEVSR